MHITGPRIVIRKEITLKHNEMNIFQFIDGKFTLNCLSRVENPPERERCELTTSKVSYRQQSITLFLRRKSRTPIERLRMETRISPIKSGG